MTIILNLTQHLVTPEQYEAGVRDLAPEMREKLVQFLTVEELPTREEIVSRCENIAKLVQTATMYFMAPRSAMIGGAPWMMPELERQLKLKGLALCYAFSKRESVEATQADGSVRKTAVFKHAGFVQA